jgi:hypothetical protein
MAKPAFYNNWNMGALPASGGVISNQSGAYGGFQGSATGTTGNIGEDPYALEVFNMSAQERLDLSKLLKDAGRLRETTSKYNKDLADAYLQAAMDAQAEGARTGRGNTFTIKDFLLENKQEGAGGAANTPYVTIASPSAAKDYINQTFQRELQRDASEAELKKLVPALIKAQAANPIKTKMVKGVRQTIQGLDTSQWITDKVKALPEFKKRAEDKTFVSIQDLQETARNNGLTLMPSQIESFKARLNNGESPDVIKNSIRAIAANTMPDSVRKLMDSGNDLSDVYQPYRQSMASVLEIPYDKIDLSDPTLTNAITDKGNMTIFDFKKSLRKDPRWQYTDNARESVSSGLTQVLKDFGFMG